MKISIKTTIYALSLCSCLPLFGADLIFRTIEIPPPTIDSALQEKFYAICEDSIASNIERIKTNRPAIDKIVNQDIPDADQLHAYYQENMQDSLEMVKESELSKDEIGFTICARDLQLKPQYIGHYHGLEQFMVWYEEYTGGAHGLYSESYYVFDSQDRHLSSQDLLEKDVEPAALIALIKSAYIDYIQQYYDTMLADSANDWKNHEEEHGEIKGEAALREAGYLSDEYLQRAQEETNNFYFTEEGLVFSYAPYVVGSFVEGQIELLLPYEKLRGIIKAQYLP